MGVDAKNVAMFSNVILIISLFLFLSGCGVVSEMANYGNDTEVFKHAEWAKQQEALFNDDIGKTCSEIEKLFGKPKIVHPISHELKYLYDELWRYENLPVGNSQSYDFWFKEGRLIKVWASVPKQSKTEKALSYLSM